MNVRTTGPPVPSTEEEPAEIPCVLVFAFEKIEFFASFAYRRCSKFVDRRERVTGQTRACCIDYNISKKIFAKAMEFQRKVGKVRAFGALRTRDTVVFQIHRARSYTKCPRRCSRMSQDVKRSSICEGEAWNRPAVVFRREAIATLLHMNDNNCNTMLVNHSTNLVMAPARFLMDFVSNELLRLPLSNLSHRGCDEVSLLRRNEALNRCLIVDRPGSLKATRAPYLLSRDEISPKRDRPRFEGSQEAFVPKRPRGTRGPRPAAMQDRKIPDASSRHPVSVVLPSGRWMTDDRRAQPIFRLNSCESYTPDYGRRRTHSPFSNSDTADTIAVTFTMKKLTDIIFLNNFFQHVPVNTFLGSAFVGFLARKGIIVRFLVESCGLTYARSIRRVTGLALLAWQGRFFFAFPNALCSLPRVRVYTVYAFSRRTNRDCIRPGRNHCLRRSPTGLTSKRLLKRNR
ncbi:hypothetical protein ALC60_00303 [Trachymyrmex zeteki]|uniref:Uncharacterized protein n=1 Tax=Mycetomoellerius zeteki TaxID=64791 RepID=A0A151XK69_9HYME|nr:hypothetical protein ALC60_00303 [Trachymyrmex zeteki]